MSLFAGPKEDVIEIIDHAIEKAAESIAGTVLPAIIDQATRAIGDDVVIEIRIRRARPDA